MKTINEVLSNKEDTWQMITEWLNEKKVCYEILKTTKREAEDTLVKLLVTAKSTLGSIAYNTRVILFDKL